LGEQYEIRSDATLGRAPCHWHGLRLLQTRHHATGARHNSPRHSAQSVQRHAFALEVDGTSFAGDAFVNFNGKQTPTSVTATKIMVNIPASAIMNSGTVAVTVTNPGKPGGVYGGGTSDATSTPMNFTIN